MGEVLVYVVEREEEFMNKLVGMDDVEVRFECEV